MVRRSFRVGLRLGLLAGVLFVVVKVVQSRRGPRDDEWRPSPEPSWPPLQGEPVTPEPAASTAARPGAGVVKQVSVPSPAAERRADEAGEATGAADARAAEPKGVSPAQPTGERAAEPKGVSPAQPTGDPAAEPKGVSPAHPTGEPAAPPAAAAPGTGTAKAPAVKKTGGSPASSAARDAAADGGSPAKARGPRKRVRRSSPPGTAWVAPSGGECPPSHPVKAKLTSRLFHLPGMAAYNRTRPDRCYADETGAVKDGFTKAKR